MNVKSLISYAILLPLMLVSTNVKSAISTKSYKFWVELKDKSGSPYSILTPRDFLSQKALDRRKKAGFAVTYDDIPVSKNYINDINKCGATVVLSSRWMNAVMVVCKDSSAATTIASQTFVAKVQLLGYWNKSRSVAETTPGAFEEFSLDDNTEESSISVKNKLSAEEYNFGYGLGWQQAHMLGVEKLHQAGYRGKGMLIAIFDAGFYQANNMEAFAKLRKEKRIVSSYDFVNFDGNVYNDDDHGTQVLSCLAADVDGIMVGTAPDANYMLLRTEDAGTEFPTEEVQWLVAAEMADSAGVDLISSSLGYTEFDKKEFGHTYKELDGNTTLVTRAANMAWDRGIMIVNSAGNEGDGAWEKIGAPADAVGVIAVGAVDANGIKAGFSSLGPTADKRMKPDLAALGKRAVISSTSGYFITSNGTSYSAPILAGAVACFMQKYSSMNIATLREYIFMSGNQYLGQDSLLGYGIPNFGIASAIADGKDDNSSKDNPFISWIDSDTIYSAIDIKTLKNPTKSYYYELKNSKGKTILSGVLFAYENRMYAARIAPLYNGKYTLEVQDGTLVWTKQFIYQARKNDSEF